MENTGQEKRRHTVVVVDDDQEIMQCVGTCLERESGLEILGYARHAQAGLALAVETRPDVVLLDIHMTGADAFWACEQIVRQTNGDVKVLFYTGFPRDHYLDRCIESGGSGMLSKHTETMSDIGTAVRHVIKGNQYFSPELASRLIEIHDDVPKSRLAMLTERELIVLKQLSAGRTNREIADSLDLGLRSIEKAVSDLKRALDIPTTNELLIFAANEGIVFPEIAQGQEKVDAVPEADPPTRNPEPPPTPQPQADPTPPPSRFNGSGPSSLHH